MAGFAAAARAVQAGARVTVLEKAPSAGGTVPLMGGFLWTATDLATFMGRMTHADLALADLVVGDFESSVAWLADIGVTIGPRNDHFFEWGRGYPMEKGASQYVEVLTRFLLSRGATILTRSPGVRIRLDGEGRVAGVACLDYRRRRVREIECRAVVIATGGFQANTEMLTRYFGRWADQMFLRAIPWSTGDGIEMGVKVGAKTSKGYHAYYGQLMPAPPARVPPEDFRFVTQYASIHMILVNLGGERFVDESIYDSITAQALTREERALGFLICDGQVDDHDRRHRATPTSKLLPTERMKHVVEHGGVVVEADSLEALASMLAELGVYRQGFLATVEEFNRASASGGAGALMVPKARHAHPIARPPFYAIPVVPGISFTHGGLSINPRAEVLDWREKPVPGLFAAGADIGGLFYEQYLGGAASSLVLGRMAGAGAAEASS